MKESILPRMKTSSHETVIGGMFHHIKAHKPTIILGEPGEGKTTTVLDFCTQNNIPSHYKRCSPNTTMKSLLQFLANAVGTRIIGDNDELQSRIVEALKSDPNHCFVFDEAENLACGNGSKIDVLRQITDDTGVPIIICGTYELKDLISGNRDKHKKQNHNRPQMFRRLRKEEFTRIEVTEVSDYLSSLEKQYAVKFEEPVKQLLISHCRDRQSGGLGNFIEIIELLFSFVRPEWENISYQIIRDTGRKLHDHDEESQSFTPINREKDKKKDDESGCEKGDITKAVCSYEEENKPYIDVSQLEIVVVTMPIIKDVLLHKMTM